MAQTINPQEQKLAIAEQPAKEAPREKLPAEKAFDKTVYTGISFFAQGVAGIMLAHWLAFGQGKPLFDKIGKWLGPKMYPAKTAAKAAEEASAFIITTTQIAAGTAFIPPVKWLEDRKPEIVRSLHEQQTTKKEANGHVYTEEEKARHEKCLQELANQPKQSWWSLMEARTAALGAVYAVLMALGNDRNVKLREGFASVMKGGAEVLGMKKLAKSETFAKYMELTGVEMFYSAIAAGGLYIWSHSVRPPKKNATPDLEQAPISPTIPQPENPVPANVVTQPVSFQDRVKPKENRVSPEALYTQKLAAEVENTPPAPAM